MTDRTNATTLPPTAGPPTAGPPTASRAGLLRPEQLARHVDLGRWAPGPAASRFVENYWALAWDLPGDHSFLSETLPHPTCSLTVERATHPRPGVGEDPVVVTGVVTRRFTVETRGRARVFGVKFRPGGLVALAGGRARDWTDRVVAARAVVPLGLRDSLASLDLDAGFDEAVPVVDDAVAALRPRRDDETYHRVLAVIADMLGDRALLTVAQVEERHDVSARTLQRWFTTRVGVGPKWVLARYRMHDAVTDLDAGYDGSLTELAHRYGWFDQAHFTRDFVDLVGVTPGTYRSRPSRGTS
ncbi:MAG: helix-turn-helix transcriptional regulator [Nocardioidaceae bacterium]|nr:helix-turn-helix transcriptional regulator [Nocardioidaceae bacterium]